MKSAQQLAKDNLIVKHVSGSHAYGMNTPESDLDIRGIFCADPINVRTSLFRIEEVAVGGQDEKYFELEHYCHLAADCNPNIIETLWVDEADIMFKTPAYDLLRKNRHLFLSSKIAFTTSGYAVAQLKRIKNHKRMIVNPQPVDPPQPCDYFSLVYDFTPLQKFKINLREINTGFYILIHTGGDIYLVLYTGDIVVADLGVRNWVINTDGSFKVWPNDRPIGKSLPLHYIIKFNRSEYEAAKKEHEHYWEWKKNRNEDRAKLEEKHGFDSKHAAHLVRLMRTGKEALTEGIIRVKRPDSAELKAIRNGSMTYEEIIKYAEEMDDLIRNKLYKETTLPHSTDKVAIAKLIMEIQDMIWSGNRS